MAIRVRELTKDERKILEQRANSRTAAARTVERARIIWYSHQRLRVRAIAKKLDVCDATVRFWIKRFNAQGLQGLEDQDRSGRPSTYTEEQVSQVIATALTKPKGLDLPFGSWTLDRLVVYLNEVKGIGMKRSRVDEILIAEGLRWRTEESWFGERVDPQFAEKRG